MHSKEFPYDAVIVLSQSDWHTEMRSNRFHYTTRFSELVPTYFVQNYNPSISRIIDGKEGNITIVNPVHGYSYDSIYKIMDIVRSNGGRSILFWIYSPFYTSFLKRISSSYSCIYHATEAFLDSDMVDGSANPDMAAYLELVKKTINHSNFVVSVSDGITESLRKNSEISSPVFTISNGCDFNFWYGLNTSRLKRTKAVLYQGGIHKKIDFDLLIQLAKNNTEVEFWLCGENYFTDQQDEIRWKELIRQKNVTYYGKLTVEKVRELSHRARIGIIPFKINDWLIAKAFPLKAFEYLSAGLDVVTTPIEALKPYSIFFDSCSNFDEFDAQIKKLLLVEEEYDNPRIEACKAQDYSLKFKNVLQLIAKHKLFFSNKYLQTFKKRVLLLYDTQSCHVSTIREHVNAYGLFSRHEITYYHATSGNKINETFLKGFDAVAIHYSVRVSVPGHLSADIYKKLQQYNGYKILFIQDEYDNLPSTYAYMMHIKFDAVFTCVPDKYVSLVYPRDKFPNVKYINNFTGYVSYGLFNYNVPLTVDRSNDIFYRGRRLPYFYGTLGMEKYEIGIKFKQAIKDNDLNLIVDIESDDDKRIYGDAWYYTLSRSKATLATESGSNLFDFDGNLRQLIDEDIAAGKDYTYIFNKHIRDQESSIRMNQISPKLFEAICLKTVLILFEGEYSGVLKPGLHYIPLKKDFSNFLEVSAILKDDQKLQEIADKAFEDIVSNEKYSYQYFIHNSFDKTIDEEIFMFREHDNGKPVYTNFFNYLSKYLFDQLEIKKMISGGASPQIISQGYEKNYSASKGHSSEKIKALLFWVIAKLSEKQINKVGKLIGMSVDKMRSIKRKR